MTDEQEQARIKRALAYINDQHPAAEAYAPKSGELAVELREPKGCIDPVHTERLAELGFEFTSVYLPSSGTDSTTVVFRAVE